MRPARKTWVAALAAIILLNLFVPALTPSAAQPSLSTIGGAGAHRSLHSTNPEDGPNPASDETADAATSNAADSATSDTGAQNNQANSGAAVAPGAAGNADVPPAAGNADVPPAAEGATDAETVDTAATAADTPAGEPNLGDTENSSLRLRATPETAEPQPDTSGASPNSPFRSRPSEVAGESRAANTSSGFNGNIVQNYLRSGKKGIVYANIDNFAYYEFAETDANGRRNEWTGWRGFGGGLDVDYVIPRGARAGDYFTLSWDPETIFIKHEPMYRDNEEVPYATLMTQPSQYKDGSSNIFFTIRTPQRAEIPDVPILNVYHTKVNELTFVVQPYAEGRKDLIGSAVIGTKVDARRLFAYTDGNGRHMRKNGMYGRYKPDGNSWGTYVGNEVYDLKESSLDPQAIETANGKHYFLFMGFEPSYEGMSLNATTNKPTQQGESVTDRYIYHRNFYYYSKYMQETSHRIEDGGTNLYGVENSRGAQINYSTALLRYDDVTQDNYRINGHGREVLIDVYEDKDYLYGYFLYNANRGSQFRVCGASRPNWCWEPGSIQGAPWVRFFTPQGQQDSLRIEEFAMYRAYDDGGPNGNFSGMHPTTLVPPMSRYPQNRAEIGAWVERGLWNVEFKPEHMTRSYVGKVKMRKIAPVNGKYAMDFYAYRSRSGFGQIRRHHRMEYQPTSGVGASLVSLDEISDNLFRLRKTDHSGEPLVATYNTSNPLVDAAGNEYTLVDSNARVYRDRAGVRYRHKRYDGRYTYTNDMGELFFEHGSGANTHYTDQYGRRFDKKPGSETEYVTRQRATKHTLSLTSVMAPGREAEGVFNFYYQIDGEKFTEPPGSFVADGNGYGGIITLRSAAGTSYRVRIENTSSSKDLRSAWKPVWIEAGGARRSLVQTDAFHYVFTSAITADGPEEIFKPARPVLNAEEMKIYIDQDLALRGVSWRYTDARGNNIQAVGEQDLYANGDKQRRGRLMTVRDNIGNIVHVEHDFNGHAIRVFDETYKVIPVSRITEPGKQGVIVTPANEAMHFNSVYTNHRFNTDFMFRLTNQRTGQTHDIRVNEYGRLRFPDLDQDDVYTLREISAGNGYKLYPHPFELRPTATGVDFYDHQGQKIHPDSTPMALVNAAENFVTLKNDRKYQIKLFKRDGEALSRGLDGRFELWHATGNNLTGERYIDVGNTTQAGNTLLFRNDAIVPGRYAFKEVTAPRGYERLSAPVFFTISPSGEVTDISAPQYASAVLAADKTTIELTIKNYRQYELPNSGGIGSWPFIVIGALVMLLALAGMRRRWQH